ncbi:Endoplasmic reticulum junction formation protein lunapark-A [Schistosoma japonicum]|nr:Endoplasmic reticulum junction formation protein lunapark-A [Schistosoma japonicum]
MILARKYLFSIFKRSKKSIVDQLEDIEDEILELENDRSSSIDSEKQFVFRLLFYSFILYGLSFIIAYYYYWPKTATGKMVICTVFAAYPFCIYFLKNIFRVLFSRRVNKTNEKLKRLRANKQKLLEEVMEKETFNKAQQILKRFDPLTFASITVEEKKTPKSVFGSMNNLITPRSDVRRRNTSGDKYLTPGLQGPNITPHSCIPEQGVNQRLVSSKPRLIRPLLPRERSIIDKFLDVLVGDGPHKRFALICNECSSHNGMALQEEFEYLAFRCCYCNHFNPSRRTQLRTSKLSTTEGTNTNDLINSQSTSCLLPKQSAKDTTDVKNSVSNISGYDSDDDTDEDIDNITVVRDSHQLPTIMSVKELSMKCNDNVDEDSKVSTE